MESVRYEPRSTQGSGRAYLPSAPLRPYVSCYFSLSVVRGPELVHTLPDGCLDLTFDLSARTGFVSGVQTTPHVHRLDGPLELLGVRFRPGGALPLLAVPPGELGGLWEPVDLVLGRIARELAEKLADAATLDARLALLDAFWLSRLDGTIDARIGCAMTELYRTSGGISIESLGQKSGASPRNLARLFHEWIGLSPKRFARIVRFQRLLERLTVERAPDWSLLAAELGYFDQAHLIRDFSEHAGATPTVHLATIKAR